MKNRIILSAILTAIFVGIAAAMMLFSTLAVARTFSKQYDDDIRSATRLYWPRFNHPLALKAQLYQESRFEVEALSPVGASGIAQFMPATWREVAFNALHYPRSASPQMARYAIPAAAFYMARLRNIWHLNRTEGDRHRLAAASYNAGAGNIIKAQRACDEARNWPDIAPCLEMITGKHAAETLHYVPAIWDWWRRMDAAR